MFSKLITVAITAPSDTLCVVTAVQPRNLVVEGADVLDDGGLPVLEELSPVQRRPAALQSLQALRVLSQPERALGGAQVQLVLQHPGKFVLQRQLDVAQGRGVLTQVVEGGGSVTQGQTQTRTWIRKSVLL